MDELVFREEFFAVVGAAIEVHRELGAGFLEAVYQEAMERELVYRDIAFESQRELVIHYRGPASEQSLHLRPPVFRQGAD